MTEHATFDKVFTIQDGEVTDDEKAALNEYLEHFAATDGQCVKCDRKLVGGIADHLLGQSTFRWGLQHGHGNCSSCGWPVVVYHFPKGTILERFEAALCVHPDYVKVKQDG